MKQIKIAIFHLGFFYSGGGERLVLEEIDGLTRMGFAVTCFTPVLDRKKSFPDIIDRYPIKTILPFSLNFLPDCYAIQIILSCLLLPFIFFRFINYDLFIGANQPGPWLAFILSKILKKPYLIYLAQPTRILYPRPIDEKTGLKIHDGFSLLPKLIHLFRPLVVWADKISVVKAKVRFANGLYIKEVLEKVYQVPFISCPAGAEIKPLSLKKAKKTYLLITNRHFPQKRFEYAVEALSYLTNQFPDLYLVITGEETLYTKYLKKLILQLGLFQKVIFTGLVGEKRLSSLYRNALGYLYTSPQEDFGMGIIEAMSYQLPVVAWGFAGPSKIITHGKSGFLAKPYNMHDFIKYIKIIITNPSKAQKIGKNARQAVVKNYTYQKHNQMLQKAILSLVKKLL